MVCAADIRGVGALLPEFSPGHTGYAASHRQEENYAWGSLILGKPLVGQRVTDILAIGSRSAQDIQATAGSPIRIAAAGRLTVPALFAAALDPGIQDSIFPEGWYPSGIWWTRRRTIIHSRTSSRAS